MSARSKSPRIRQSRRWSGRRAGFSPERSGCGKFDLRGSQDFDWLRRTPFLDSFRVADDPFWIVGSFGASPFV